MLFIIEFTIFIKIFKFQKSSPMKKIHHKYENNSTHKQTNFVMYFYISSSLKFWKKWNYCAYYIVAMK